MRAIAVVTGANGGVGYGICERLLLQLSRPDPPDMMPQTHVDPFFSVSSLDPAPKKTPFDSLTIILACRNRSRATEARDKLLVFIDTELNKRRINGGGREESYGQIFRSKLELDFILCDLASASSVLQFCQTVQQRYPYITHVFCNAGVGAFDGVEWFGAIKHILRNPIEAVTYPNYKIQRKGVLSEDGFGWVWQCNILGHYLMIRNLMKSLSSCPPPALPARILWTTSLDIQPSRFDRSLEDWQLIETHYSYELSKFQTELIASRLGAKYRDKEQDVQTFGTGTAATRAVRHFIVHPGITATNMFSMIGPVMSWLMLVAMYIVRYFGSLNHNIKPIVGARSAVHVALVPISCLPPAEFPVVFGTQTDRRGGSWVSSSGSEVFDPSQGEGMEKVADALIIKCDSLCEVLEKKEGMIAVNSAATIDGNAQCSDGL